MRFDPIDQSVLQNLDPPFLFNAERTLSQCDKSLPKGATADLDFFFTKSLTACGQACNEFNRNLTKSDMAPGNFNGTKYFCNAAEWSVKPQFSWGANCWIKVIKNICARPPKDSKELTFVSMITHLPNGDCASCFTEPWHGPQCAKSGQCAHPDFAATLLEQPARLASLLPSW